MAYGAEAWAARKAQEKKLDVVEMRRLRCTCRVTKLDGTRALLRLVWPASRLTRTPLARRYCGNAHEVDRYPTF